jgi:hypothetical protein
MQEIQRTRTARVDDMTKTIYFEPREGLQSQQNLKAFIELCKNDLKVFGADLPFGDNVWDISNHIEHKAQANQRIIISFSTLLFSKRFNGVVTNENIIAMQEPYLSFAKAYIRYQFGRNPIKSISNKIIAHRILEKALIEMTDDANTIDINNDILNKAVEIIKANYESATAYRLGQEVETIGNFLAEKQLVKVAIDWKNSLKRPTDTSRVGAQADNKRNKKMPSQKALEVLPEIFNKAQSPYELMASSIIALLMCAPNRINEIFLLPYDLEVLQKDKHGNEVFGLRWFPAKGAKPMVKWIIPSMVDVAKESIRRIKELTKPAREVAKWYEKKQDKLYLPKELEYLRDTNLLDIKEISYILFGTDDTDKDFNKKRSSIHVWLKTNHVLTIMIKGKKHARFADVEKAILKLLPDRFPYLNDELGLKYSEALILQRTNELNRQKDIIIPSITSFTHGFIADALGARNNNLSLFEAFNYKEIDGTPLKVTSHQFRHYLNTLAQKGGASQLDIAKWSGRLNVHQNKDYDHLTADDMLLSLQDAIGDSNLMVGPLADIEDIKKKVVISRDEFSRLKLRTAHVTEFGICIHDYTMTPCSLYRDCMNCVEQVCMKGDKERTDRIKQTREDTMAIMELIDG